MKLDAQIAWLAISVNICNLHVNIEKLRNEAHALCPAVPDMLYAGKQLDDQNSDLGSYISDLCGKVDTAHSDRSVTFAVELSHVVTIVILLFIYASAVLPFDVYFL